MSNANYISYNLTAEHADGGLRMDRPCYGLPDNQGEVRARNTLIPGVVRNTSKIRIRNTSKIRIKC